MEYPLSTCDQPPDTGPCDGAFPRYYYDAATDSCQRLNYGGCEGNENNFETLRGCERTCAGR
jgi:hypothetical protein